MVDKVKRRKRLLWLIPVVLIGLGLIGFLMYAAVYYHADVNAEEAMRSGADVQITETDYGWFFDGEGEENALIFYPGAKVEETAYAPLLREIAKRGIDVCLVKMPLRFAVFGANKAEKVMREYEYDHWYIGGHSLGGAMAADFAAAKGDGLDGVILLAAYSTKKLDQHLDVVLIYGSEDKVLSMEKYSKYMRNVPDMTSEHIIGGGNHAQFGSYGPQKGDGKALIPPEEQVNKTVDAILKKVKPQKNTNKEKII